MTENIRELQWWGYRHTNGTFHVKRYLDDPGDLQEARESPFVDELTGPFLAANRESAMTHARERLGGGHGTNT